MKRNVGLSMLLIGALLSGGCQSWNAKLELPQPLRVEPKAVVPAPADSASEPADSRADVPSTGFSRIPQVPEGPSIANRELRPQQLQLEGEPVELNFENMPIPAFINEVYAELLGLSFKLNPALEKKKDLVTLRVTEPMPRSDLYRMANKVLADYGIQVTSEEGLLNFSVSRGTPAGDAPLLISGRTLPDVPVSHRPVFQIVTLQNVRNTSVRGWLAKLFQGQPLVLSEDAERNAIILQGKPLIVQQALEALEVLDQPSMRGRHSLRIEPVFQSPAALGEALVTVLQSEGYGASSKPPMGSVLILPMEQINAILVFSSSKQLLEHITDWAKALDKPARTGDEGGLFYYEVQNTRADELSKILTELFGHGSGAVAPAVKGAAQKPAAAQPAKRQKLVVDGARNAIIFYGQADEWARLLPVLREMDVTTKQVLVEVTLAEVTLTEDEQFGVEWLGQGSVGDFFAQFGTLGSLGVADGGAFSYTLSKGGVTRGLLSALASDQRVNIIATPRIMAKSGSEASINVGTEVPVITSQATATDVAGATAGTSSIMQNIQYRKTGTILTLKPTIYSSGRVDIDIAQELSSAQNNQTSGVDSPTILNRSLKTSLSLRDGESVLLGGLISSDQSSSNTGVPLMKDLPLLGGLFSKEGMTKTRTELLLIIAPYILEQPGDASDMTRAFVGRMDMLVPESAQAAPTTSR